MHKGFSLFSWALALFCLPSALFPLALMVSTKLSHHPHLSSTQIDFFSIAFWIYPLVLLTMAGILYKLYRHRPRLAWSLLGIGLVGFYWLFVTAVRLF